MKEEISYPDVVRSSMVTLESARADVMTRLKELHDPSYDFTATERDQSIKLVGILSEVVQVLAGAQITVQEIS